MPVPFAPIDAATIAALKGGDEKALEKIFRAHYDALLDRAKEKLKDEPAAAPRLVAAVVRELWEVRATLSTSTEIEGFFNEELRNRAAAIRQRMRSVHRFEKTEGVGEVAVREAPSPDELWTEIKTAMHQPVLDPAEVAKRRRTQAAHGAASHIANVSAKRSIKTPLIIATIGAIVIVGGIWWADAVGKAATVTQLLAGGDAQMIQTRQGQLGSLPLSDGSTVRLAAESKITLVPKFGQEYRSASLVGSAAITVAPGNPVPLEVRVENVSVKASAGEFAVRKFADDSMVYVAARGDGVLVAVKGAERTLKTGETIVIASDNSIRDATEDEAAQNFGWVDGKLVLRNVTVATAAKKLWRWFAIEVAVTDSAARERVISISVPLESSKAAIEAIAGAGGVVFGYDKDNKMIFSAPAPTRRKAR